MKFCQDGDWWSEIAGGCVSWPWPELIFILLLIFMFVCLNTAQNDMLREQNNLNNIEQKERKERKE
jgi:hypothetical protein